MARDAGQTIRPPVGVRGGDRTAVLTAKFFRGLGDPTRVQIVQLLLDQPRTVSELVALLDAPQGRVSAHLGCLRWCGFVESVRAGRSVIYRVADPRVRMLLATAQELLQENADRVASCFIIDTRDYAPDDAPDSSPD